jgi:hypothetical protein
MIPVNSTVRSLPTGFLSLESSHREWRGELERKQFFITHPEITALQRILLFELILASLNEAMELAIVTEESLDRYALLLSRWPLWCRSRVSATSRPRALCVQASLRVLKGICEVPSYRRSIT